MNVRAGTKRVPNGDSNGLQTQGRLGAAREGSRAVRRRVGAAREWLGGGSERLGGGSGFGRARGRFGGVSGGSERFEECSGRLGSARGQF